MIQSKLLTGDKERDRVHLKATINLNGKTGQEIARDCKITPQAVSGVINRKYNLQKVLSYIEKLPRQIRFSEN